MGIFSKKPKENVAPKQKKFEQNRAQRRKNAAWDAGAPMREAKSRAKRQHAIQKKAIAARVKRKADAAHERAVQRRLKAGLPVTYSRRRRNYPPAKA